MTTNLDCITATLAAHREARMWDDGAVAADLVAQLGLDPAGTAKNAKPVADPDALTEDQVKALEAAAKDAIDKAKAARDALLAQTKAAEAPPPAPMPAHADEAAATHGSGRSSR